MPLFLLWDVLGAFVFVKMILFSWLEHEQMFIYRSIWRTKVPRISGNDNYSDMDRWKRIHSCLYFPWPARVMLLIYFLKNLVKFNLLFQFVSSQASFCQLCRHLKAGHVKSQEEDNGNEITCALAICVFFFGPTNCQLAVKVFFPIFSKPYISPVVFKCAGCEVSIKP